MVTPVFRYYSTRLVRGRGPDHYHTNNLERNLPAAAFRRVESLSEADVAFVVLREAVGAEFDEALAASIAKSGKHIVVFDHLEFGAGLLYRPGFERLNTLMSQNPDFFTRHFGASAASHLASTAAFLNARQEQITCYFKRELLRDREVYAPTRYPVLPLDYTCPAAAPAPASLAAFLAKPIDLTMIYGMTNKSRAKLHAKYLDEWGSRIPVLCSHVDELESCLESGLSGITFMMHASLRHRVHQGKFIEKSVLTLDMHGNGVKCFRNAEACRGSIPVRQDTSFMEYAYEWQDGVNCITIPNRTGSLIVDADAAFERIEAALSDKPALYEIYVNACKMAQAYESRRYAVRHLASNILESLGVPPEARAGLIAAQNLSAAPARAARRASQGSSRIGCRTSWQPVIKR